MDPFKRYIKLLLGVFLGGALAVLAINWMVDPLQFYRKASYPPYLIGQKRFQAPGLARNYDYDTVVIGTSVSENFESVQIQEALGGKALNLSMQGASAREQHLMLEVALRTGKVRRVIWDLQYEYLRGDPNWVANYDGDFPFYLYDENPFNKINNYLLSVDATKSSAKILLRWCGLPTYVSRTPDETFAWYRTKTFGEASVRKAWTRAVKDRPITFTGEAQYALSNLNANFDLHMLAPIRQHPEATFFLYFPPFSIGYYVNLAAGSPERFENMLQNKQHILERTKDLPQVRLFDFQTMPEVISDPRHYCDLMHYDLYVNRYILDSFRSDRRRVRQLDPAELRSLAQGPMAAQWLKQITPSL